jgi:hypothetical protein
LEIHQARAGELAGYKAGNHGLDSGLTWANLKKKRVGFRAVTTTASPKGKGVPSGLIGTRDIPS